MNKFLPLLFLVTLFGLVGCGPTRYEVIEKTTYVYVGVPKTLTSKITPPAPPAVEQYKELSCPAQRSSLTTYAVDLVKLPKLFNNRFDSIEVLDAQNRQTVEKMNRAEEERVAKLIGQRVKERESAR